MIVSFTASSKILLDAEGQKTTLRESKIWLEISKNLDKDVYLHRSGAHKEAATKPITQTFIHGLLANVKTAHKNGWWNEEEHMDYIIAKLKEGFLHPTYADPKIGESEREDPETDTPEAPPPPSEN